MPLKNSAILFLLISIIGGGCQESTIGHLPPEEEETYKPAFMYANDNGQLRILMTSPEEEKESYAIDSYSHNRVGIFNQKFGIVDTSFRDNAYDWSPFNKGENPNIALTLIRKNPTYVADLGQQFKYYYQVSLLTNTKAPATLYFNSDIKNKRVELQYLNYNKGAKGRSVSFADRNTLLVYYTDFTTDPNVDFANRGYLLRYSLDSQEPFMGEVIANFNLSGILGTDPPSSYTLHSPEYTRISPSANGKYYYVWTEIPRWGKYSSPFVLNSNGTYALDPTNHNLRDYRNPNGYHIAYLEPHPLDDELLVSVDVSSPYSYAREHNAIHLLRMPNNKDEWFTTLKTLEWQDVYFEGPEYVDPNKTRHQDNIYLKYHPEGEKIAIAHAIEGTSPSPAITVWSTKGDSTDYYVLPEIEGYEFDTIGEPGWLYTNNDLLYFMAGDTNKEEAFIFYIDISKDSPPDQTIQAKRIPWNAENLEYLDIETPDEGVSSVRDLKGRELGF